MDTINNKLNNRIIRRDYCYGRDSPFFISNEGRINEGGRWKLEKPIYEQNTGSHDYKLWLDFLENKQNPGLKNFQLQWHM